MTNSKSRTAVDGLPGGAFGGLYAGGQYGGRGRLSGGRSCFVCFDVGLVIDDLQQIDALLGALTPARYQEMLQNVQAVQRRVRSGYYVRTAVEKALALL